MREDFREKIGDLNQIGIVRVCTDFYMQPNNRLFVKSPISQDKNYSMKLYPATNSFCDFAAGNKGGDIVRLVSYVHNVDNWQALKLLCNFYGLSDDRGNKKEALQQVKQQQEQERKRTARRHEFSAALFGHINALQQHEQNLKVMIQEHCFEPFTDEWSNIINQLQITQYKLDILSGAVDKEYYRMKPVIDKGISSDRPKWLLDCLAILENDGKFSATEEELTEIKAQQEFELYYREPKRDRECKILW